MEIGNLNDQKREKRVENSCSTFYQPDEIFLLKWVKFTKESLEEEIMFMIVPAWNYLIFLNFPSDLFLKFENSSIWHPNDDFFLFFYLEYKCTII